MILPKLDIFHKYNQTHLPRPQPSDMAVNFLNHMDGGFFVDIGANDGISCNNSVVFEQGYNWNGLCVEPHPIMFKKLIKYRNPEKCFNLGLANENNILEFWSIDGEAQSLSGFEKFFTETQRNRILNDVIKNNDKLDKIPVTIKKTSDFFLEQNIKHIDYLSIDAEGADLEIVKGIDFEKVNITLISIEADGHSEETIDFLHNKNYNYLGMCCADHFFIKK